MLQQWNSEERYGCNLINDMMNVELLGIGYVGIERFASFYGIPEKHPATLAKNI